MSRPRSSTRAGAEAILDLACELGAAVVVSEQRPALPLERCDRVLFVENGRVTLDAPREEALGRLDHAYRPRQPELRWPREAGGEVLAELEGVSHAYDTAPVLTDASLQLRRGEILALTGPNGVGKTTLAKIASGLIEPDAGRVERRGARLLPLPGPRPLPRHRAGRGRGCARGRRRPHPRRAGAGERRPRRLRATSPARSLERRARAPRPRLRPRRRPRRARPRRAHPWGRPAAQERARGAPAARRGQARDSRRDPRSRLRGRRRRPRRRARRAGGRPCLG